MKFAWNRKSSVLFAFVLVAFILSATWGCKEDEKKEEAPAAPEESSSEVSPEESSTPAPAPEWGHQSRKRLEPRRSLPLLRPF